MFISTLLLIPWIIFGFRHPEQRFLGLPQTKKSLLTLLLTEIAFFITLILLLDKPNPNIAGQGDFGWTYLFIYEKGILPVIGLIEINDPLFHTLGKHSIAFFITALMMDYLLLKFISPQIINRLRLTKKHKQI